eukprot:TRINITY_DN29311_c0_g2_i1.p1 TRINITY_DN29311_c0_g2~~TRINITY_DN29311_c0_g2_i1.p1  ORF type:complete len:650 (-),score=160.07 TRINITY_DN29311_c0_g2_i1:84-2033(-)
MDRRSLKPMGCGRGRGRGRALGRLPQDGTVVAALPQRSNATRVSGSSNACKADEENFFEEGLAAWHAKEAVEHWAAAAAGTCSERLALEWQPVAPASQHDAARMERAMAVDAASVQHWQPACPERLPTPLSVAQRVQAAAGDVFPSQPPLTQQPLAVAAMKQLTTTAVAAPIAVVPMSKTKRSSCGSGAVGNDAKDGIWKEKQRGKSLRTTSHELSDMPGSRRCSARDFWTFAAVALSDDARRKDILAAVAAQKRRGRPPQMPEPLRLAVRRIFGDQLSPDAAMKALVATQRWALRSVPGLAAAASASSAVGGSQTSRRQRGASRRSPVSPETLKELLKRFEASFGSQPDVRSSACKPTAPQQALSHAAAAASSDVVASKAKTATKVKTSELTASSTQMEKPKKAASKQVTVSAMAPTTAKTSEPTASSAQMKKQNKADSKQKKADSCSAKREQPQKRSQEKRLPPPKPQKPFAESAASGKEQDEILKKRPASSMSAPKVDKTVEARASSRVAAKRVKVDGASSLGSAAQPSSAKTPPFEGEAPQGASNGQVVASDGRDLRFAPGARVWCRGFGPTWPARILDIKEGDDADKKPYRVCFLGEGTQAFVAERNLSPIESRAPPAPTSLPARWRSRMARALAVLEAEKRSA